MRFGGLAAGEMIRRLASMTVVILVATMASTIVLSRSASTPQVSAAQMAELTEVLASDPSGSVDDNVLRDVSQIIIDEPGDTEAAVDYYLKLEGIDGESAAIDDRGLIELESWSWGESNASSGIRGGGGGAGKVSMQDFHFVMKASKASPKLFLACATGQHIKEAKLTARRSDGQKYLEIHLKDVLITSYQTAASGGGVPTDQISISFSRIEFTYWPQLPDGSLDAPVKAGYDLVLNKKV